MLTLKTTIVILAQGPSCVIGTQHSFCSHCKRRAAERLTGINHYHRTRDIHSQFLRFWHIGLSCRLAPGTDHIYSLLPPDFGMRYPGSGSQGRVEGGGGLGGVPGLGAKKQKVAGGLGVGCRGGPA